MVERSMYDASKIQRRESNAVKDWIASAGMYWDEVLDTDENTGMIQIGRYPGQWFPVFNRIMPEVGGIVLVGNVGAGPVVLGPPPEELSTLQIAPEDPELAQHGVLYRIVSSDGSERIVTVSVNYQGENYYAEVGGDGGWYSNLIRTFKVANMFRLDGDWDIDPDSGGYGTFPSMRAAFDVYGNIYITDHADDSITGGSGSGSYEPYAYIRKYNPAGVLISSFPIAIGTGAGQIQSLGAIAVARDGNILVVDSGVVNARVLAFSSAGVYVRSYGSTTSIAFPPNGRMGQIADVAQNEDTGNIYITDFTHSRVHVFQENGTYLTRYITPGTEAPKSIAIDIGGAVYISLQFSGDVYALDSNLNYQYMLTESEPEGTEPPTPGKSQGIILDVQSDASGYVYVLDSRGAINVYYQGAWVGWFFPRHKPTGLFADILELPDSLGRFMAASNGRLVVTHDANDAAVQVYEIPGVGIQGPVGAQGDTGPQGEQGIEGRSGPSVTYYNGHASPSSTSGFMSSGSIRTDSPSNMTLATKIMVADVDQQSVEQDGLIVSGMGQVGSHVRVESATDSLLWVEYKTTSPAVDEGDHFWANVEYVSGTTETFEMFSPAFLSMRPPGPPGPQGVEGPVGPEGQRGRPGPGALYFHGQYMNNSGTGSIVNGDIRVDTPLNMIDATKVRVAWRDWTGTSQTDMLLAGAGVIGSHVRIENAENDLLWVEYKVTGFTQESFYLELDVIYIGGTVSTMTDNDQTLFNMKPPGPQGEQGPQGDAGPPGPSSGESPTGVMVAYSMSTPPSGWLLCDGSEILRSTTLGALLVSDGMKYGIGDGSTTVNIPDLRGRVPVGLDSGMIEFATMGQLGGAINHLLTGAQSGIATHKHGPGTMTTDNPGTHVHSQDGGGVVGRAPGSPNTAAGNSPNTGGGGDHTHSILGETADVAAADASEPHNNLQPYVTINWIIKE